MIPRVLEPEAMDTPEDSQSYDAMDHSAVNARFVADFLVEHGPCRGGLILDVGTGTARIPIELCRVDLQANVLGIDLAPTMLDLAARNVTEASLADRITLAHVDAKRLPYPDGYFEAVLSNTIIHHIADPTQVLGELTRVVANGGTLMVRDLARPGSSNELEHLVKTYTEGESALARELFHASLHAAFEVQEIQAMVLSLGLSPESVVLTSDRHWTWTWKRPGGIGRYGSDRT